MVKDMRTSWKYVPTNYVLTRDVAGLFVRAGIAESVLQMITNVGRTYSLVHVCSLKTAYTARSSNYESMTMISYKPGDELLCSLACKGSPTRRKSTTREIHLLIAIPTLQR